MIEGWIEADWPAPPGVRAGIATRRFPGVSVPPFDRANFGARCGDDPDAVARNRALLRDALQLPSEPRWLHQVHGITVVDLDDGQSPWERAQLSTAPATDEPQADAAVTRAPGTVLAILTADCLPVIFATDDGATLAAAHAGWRGLAAGILEATIDAMRADPARILAWFGPAAGPRAYEVGEDVRTTFVDRDAAAAVAFAPTRPGHWHCDLPALARRRLVGSGVVRFSGGTCCTIGDPARFFSHRRDRQTGRMVTVAWRSRE